MVQPTPEVIQSHNLKRPEDFTRETFRKLIVKAHKENGVTIAETVCFLEPHANGLLHHNALVRAESQYRWKETAQTLFQKYRVSVSFGSNIRTWSEGVVYGCVGSEHKKPEMLDKTPKQWAAQGVPAKLEEHIPRAWRQPGFVRKVKMAPLAFLDVCRKHNVKTEEGAWALAADFEEKGDKGLMAFLFENEVEAALAKVQKATGAKENARRGKLTRLEILEEYARDVACTCKSPGLAYGQLKDLLQKNNMDGDFQREVWETLDKGRQKQRNLCLVGSTNMGKSFLYKPLVKIFKTYSRPDGGSHQLEGILDKEIVFLNDFEYDEDAKK